MSRPQGDYYGNNKLSPICSSSSKNTSSRAIAIKKLDWRHEDEEREHILCENKRYEWATWQMYDRIMNHRTKQNFSVPRSSRSRNAETVVTHQTSTYLKQDIFSNHEEVFELEI